MWKVGTVLALTTLVWSGWSTGEEPIVIAPAAVEVTGKIGHNIGDEAPEIAMNNPKGKEMKLSDLRGSYVLIDFWASWCGPCRRENPNVVRAYEKYKDQGFEVFSVSLDSDASRWKKAIEQDQLSWPSHVSDLAGWRNAAAREYGISSIPHTMLIDRDGLILATHLRGSGVESALRGVFGE